MNVPIPMPRLTRIPMTVRFVMIGLTLAVNEVRVTSPLEPLALLIFLLSLGGLSRGEKKDLAKKKDLIGFLLDNLLLLYALLGMRCPPLGG